MQLIPDDSPDTRRLNGFVGLALGLGALILCFFVVALLGSKAGEVAAALGGLIGGLIGGALAAYAAYVGVKTTLEGQASSDKERRAKENAAIRLALHTEVRMIAFQCLAEFGSWRAILSAPGAQKDPRTALLPPLTIYNSVSSKIGRLSREEIVPLIGFAGSLHDVRTVAARMAQQTTTQTNNDQQTIALLLSNACGNAAKFYRAVHDIPGAERDRPFIERLEAASSAMEHARAKTPP
jgi:hypothetical protein